MSLIRITELIDTGCAHGIHITADIVLRAVRLGTLKAASHAPTTFEIDEVNRWLTQLWREDQRL